MPFASLASWRGRRIIVLSTLAVATLLVAYYLNYHRDLEFSTPWTVAKKKPEPLFQHNEGDEPHKDIHPIDSLIRRANTNFNNVLARETFNVHAAAGAYRKRRNRHPPPGFEKWYEYAKSKDAVMIEELFDQIYHDIEPFWGLDPQHIRDSVHGLNYRFSIRNGTLDKDEDKRYRVNFWHEMFRQIAEYLPDLDVAFNIMDEPRLLVPWEDIHRYVEEGGKRARLDGSFMRGVKFLNEYPALPQFDNTTEFKHDWVGQGPYWDLVRETCPPDSDARHAESIEQYLAPPVFPDEVPIGTYEGYVTNWTWAKDPCIHPHLRGLHGTFIEPVSLSTSKSLLPMLGGSKLPNNNEMLIPAPRYWTTESKFTGISFWSFFGEVTNWDRKKDAVTWRGVASGGRSRESTWAHFQRHRFLSMLNGSQVEAAEHGTFVPNHFPLNQSTHLYNISASTSPDSHTNHTLPHWIESFTNAAVTDLECFPKTHGVHCPYTDAYYKVASNMDMYKMYAYKYLPDIDGNSFSGRYRAFLLSTSLPIKATIYNEWHDSRLWAWKHFVPMDNTFVDLYGIMEYFLGYDGGGDERYVRKGHDGQAKKIALAGKEWAEKVLRKEDMLIYIYRLMLEYARVSSPERERMGFVKDL